MHLRGRGEGGGGGGGVAALCCGNADGHEAARRGSQAADESALQRSWLLTVANICVGNRAALDEAEHSKQHTHTPAAHTHSA